MKKLLYILPVLALLATSCSNKNVLEGQLPNSDNDGREVFLLTAKNFESPLEPIDTTKIENGKFSFELDEKDSGIGVGYIIIKEPVSMLQNGVAFFYENGTIKMELDTLSRVTGTSLNNKNQAFLDELALESKKGEELVKKFQSTTDVAEQQQYYGEIMTLKNALDNKRRNFVKENIKNKIGEFYLVQYSDAFNESQMQEMLALASPEYKAQIDKLLTPEEAQSNFVGQKYIDVTGTTPNGNSVSLSEYIGKNKVVLIDFWASWCGPCRVEMPNVVEAYNKYKSKGFEIVGISLDEDKKAWTDGIKDMSMTWVHISDLKGWGSELSAPYEVTSIPFTLLVDQEGNIIAENLRGTALDSKLGELLD